MGKASKRRTGFKSDRFGPGGDRWSDARRPDHVAQPAEDEIVSEGFRVPRTLVHKIDIRPAPSARVAWPLLAGMALGVIATAVTVLVVTSRPPQPSPDGPRTLTVLAKPKSSASVPTTRPVPSATPPAAVPQTSAAASSMPSVTTIPSPAARIEPEALTLLLKRGADLMAIGDVTSARNVLRYAAETGEARAALAVAETYDPAVLGRLGVRGVAPDLVNAQMWYEKARQLGSREAPGRLEMLARRTE